MASLAKPRGLEWLLLGQAALIAVVVALPFGFDHPSSLGLDFDDFLVVAAAYVGLAIAGIVVAAKRRSWPLAGLQLLVPCALVALSLGGVLPV